MILEAVENAPPLNSPVFTEYFAQFQQKFFEVCDKELEKINLFYEAKLAEINHKYTLLRDEMKLVEEMAGTELLARPSMRIKNRQYRQTVDMTKILTRHATHDFKAAFSELYLNAILLRNYQILNYTGFRKMLKKYDKVKCKNFNIKILNACSLNIPACSALVAEPVITICQGQWIKRYFIRIVKLKSF